MTTTPGLPPLSGYPLPDVNIPPLNTDGTGADAGASAVQRPTRTTLQLVAAWGALAALVLSLIGIGWGFTQWSSAKQWRSRAQKTEAQFDTLEQRATKAEARQVAAQRANAATRSKLVKTEDKLAKLADQQAFTADLRAQFCEILPLPASDRARICQ
jgi:hypothetical protein